MTHRIIFASYRNRTRALDALEDAFATGAICEGEHPTVEYERGRWCIVLYYFGL